MKNPHAIAKMKATKLRQGETQRARNPKHALPDKKVVYLHYHQKTQEFFWCGHGNWARPGRTSNRSIIWKDYVARNGSDWDIVLFQTGLDKDIAWWLEKHLTLQIGSVHDRTGPLLNHTGKRGMGYHTQKTKEKISESIREWHKQRNA